jgi:glutamate carboxypeptidase
MEAAHPECLRRLIRWCNQNSWSCELENLITMAATLRDDFAEFGVDFQTVDLPDLQLLGEQEDWLPQPTGPALLWHHHPQAERRLLLMIHYDTVYPPGALPDRCHVTGPHLVGPGVADAKGGIAVLAMAVEAILKFELSANLGLSILLNPDEEVGSSGSRELMRQLAPQFDAALLFEPTLPNGCLVAARKGSGNFSLVVRGKSAHAGRNPDEGRNAIVQAARIIERLTTLHHPPSGTFLNVGRIRGGDSLNQVPDLATLQFNVRVANLADPDRILKELERMVREFSDSDYRVSLQGEFHCPPKPIDLATEKLQSFVAAAGSRAGRQIAWADTGGACDGSKLAAFGLPNIDTLGVDGGDLHSPAEFCLLESIVPAAHTVAAFVAEFAAHDPSHRHPPAGKTC